MFLPRNVFSLQDYLGDKRTAHSVKVKAILVSHIQYNGRGTPVSGTCAITDLSAGLSEPSRLPFPTTCTLDDEHALPMQLTASQVYVPRDVGSSGLAVSANTSPALISWPSLYQRSTGVGTPTTLHSRDTVPCSVSRACSCSRNSGALYAFGTGKYNLNLYVHRRAYVVTYVRTMYLIIGYTAVQ
jgi:hypothetical protein